MARAGRKRKTNVVRDASGKSRGERFDPSLIFNQPHRRDCPQPWDDKAGYPLGRLLLNGLITDGQHRAGNEYAAVVYSYARTMGIPMGSPRACSMSEYISGREGGYEWEGDKLEIDPEEAAKRIVFVKDRYNNCHETLTELGRLHNRGHKILHVMRDVCIQESQERGLWADPDKLGDLRLGLNAVQKVLLEQRRI